MAEKESADKAKSEKVKSDKALAEKPKSEKPKADKPNFLQRMVAGVRRYFRETIGELRKVQWPTRREAINLTIVVLIVSFVMAAFLGGLDYIFSELLKLIL